VPLALPGEQARVRITASKPGYATAEVEEIIRAAPERIAPACPHFGVCGGCHYQHTDYATQLAFKQVILRRNPGTRRRGRAAKMPCWLASPNPNPGAIATESVWPSMRRGTWAIAAAARTLWFRCASALSPRRCWSRRAGLAEVARGFAPALRSTEIGALCDPAETALLATVFTASPAKLRFDELARALHERIPALIGAELMMEGSTGQQPRTLARWGAGSLDYHAAGFDFRVDHGAFFRSTAGRWTDSSSGLSSDYKANLPGISLQG